MLCFVGKYLFFENILQIKEVMVLSAPIIFKWHRQVQLKQERSVKLILAIAFEVIRKSYQRLKMPL